MLCAAIVLVKTYNEKNIDRARFYNCNKRKKTPCLGRRVFFVLCDITCGYPVFLQPLCRHDYPVYRVCARLIENRFHKNKNNRKLQLLR
jgi:hypothetical protein